MSNFALSVHKNQKIIASLCITRPPLLLQDDPLVSNFRKFQQEWFQKNDHSLKIDDSLLFMHAPKHFLPTPEELAKSAGKAVAAATSEIDSLVASEGLRRNARRERAVKKTKQQLSMENKKMEISSKAADATEGDMNRMPEEFLHLLIKRAGVWQLPWGNRRASEKIEDTLMRVTADQLGFEPFFPGFSPLNFTTIPGAKIFYYRAWVNKCKIKNDESIEDYAWLTRLEMKQRVSQMTWFAIDPILPLTQTRYLRRCAILP